MDIENVKTLIRLGFEPARYFKRSAWVKVERVMEFLVNKGFVIKLHGQVKYGSHNGGYTEDDLNLWAKAFMESPLSEHIDAMKELSKQTGLPLNSKELLNEYMKLK